MFPLCQRPGSVAVLDDDPSFLAVVEHALGRHWTIRSFTRADDLRKTLDRDGPFWEADVWLQQEVVADWRTGSTSLAAGVVNYWRRQTERFACTRVCLIDYRLQGQTGLDVVRNLGEWKGRKLLVTGDTDARLPAKAEESGLFNGFFSKGRPRFLPELVEAIRRFQHETDPRLQSLWSGTLSRAQRHALEQPGVASDVQCLLRHRVIEYTVLAEPFGVLCLDEFGGLHWLALHLQEPRGTVSDADLRADLRLSAKGASVGTCSALGQGAGVFGCLFQVLVDSDFEPPGGYRRWLGLQHAARAPDEQLHGQVQRARLPSGGPVVTTAQSTLPSGPLTRNADAASLACA